MIRGDRLRLLRQQKGVSADEAAAHLKMSKSQLLNYENEKSDPSTDALLRLMDYYDTSADYLLGRSEVKNKSILSVSLRPPEVLQKLGIQKAVPFLKGMGVPVKIEPIDVVELLHIFPPEQVAAFLKAMGIDMEITGDDSSDPE